MATTTHDANRAQQFPSGPLDKRYSLILPLCHPNSPGPALLFASGPLDVELLYDSYTPTVGQYWTYPLGFTHVVHIEKQHRPPYCNPGYASFALQIARRCGGVSDHDGPWWYGGCYL